MRIINNKPLIGIDDIKKIEKYFLSQTKNNEIKFLIESGRMKNLATCIKIKKQKLD